MYKTKLLTRWEELITKAIVKMNNQSRFTQVNLHLKRNYPIVLLIEH
jgi:hypothetical protein